MNLFWHELRSNRKSTAIWIVALSLLVVVFLSMFPAFTSDVGASQKILSSLPPALRSALDLSLQNFFTVYGFFSYLFTFVALAGALQAMNLGVGLLSKEETSKTVDFLLTKPVSRRAVVSQKILAATVLIVVTNAIFSVVALAMAKVVSTASFSSQTFLLLTGMLMLIQLFFLALGVFISVVIPRIKSVITVTLPTVFTFFVIGTLGAIFGNDKVRYFSPFKFYDSNYVISHGAYETQFLIIEAVLIIIALALSYIVYLKKDIRAVS